LLLGLFRGEISRDRWFPWVAGLLAVFIFGGVQLAGGAYTAEFDGHPDEAAQFMTGLMIRDYLVQQPQENPLSWAEQYYVHYPKVAFGHWPPVFHLAEAIWWLFVPPSRFTGILLVGLFGWIAAVIFYRIARSIVPPAAALLTACLLVATPVFQHSASQQMAELLSLVFGVLLLDAMVRFLRDGAQSALVECGIWCALGLLVKGTAVSLVGALLLAMLPGARWRSLGSRTMISLAAAIAAGLMWYGFTSGSFSDVRHWAGMSFETPWNVGPVLVLAGPGVIVLAAGRLLTLLRAHEPVTFASAALALSTIAASFPLHAMNETRHFILALPAILLLALGCLRGIWGMFAGSRRPWAVGIAAAAALAFFPWSRYQQLPAGYRELALQIRQPERMLVSGTQSWAEGSWIVLASLREARPSSVIVRASKVLAQSDWNGDHYQPVADTPRQAAEILDRLGIETVILDEHLPGKVIEHHRLLREALASSLSWKACGRQGSLTTFCRILPGVVPRESLRLDLRRNSGLLLVEK
jgi:hypothetical protein